jgi:hypothetical protein
MPVTTEVPHPIADAHLLEAASVFDAALALAPARDRIALQPMLVELWVRHMLRPREFLPHIGINSTTCFAREASQIHVQTYYTYGISSNNPLLYCHILTFRTLFSGFLRVF